MNHKLIVDTTTGTVLGLDDCYIINAEELGDDYSDGEAMELAVKYGTKVREFAPDDDMTPDEALHLVLAIQKKFGWSGTMFTADDIIDELESRLVEPTGEMVDAVMATYEWRKSLPNLTTSWGFECLSDAVTRVVGEADIYRLED